MFFRLSRSKTACLPGSVFKKKSMYYKYLIRPDFSNYFHQIKKRTRILSILKDKTDKKTFRSKLQPIAKIRVIFVLPFTLYLENHIPIGKPPIGAVGAGSTISLAFSGFNSA